MIPYAQTLDDRCGEYNGCLFDSLQIIFMLANTRDYYPGSSKVDKQLLSLCFPSIMLVAQRASNK